MQWLTTGPSLLKVEKGRWFFLRKLEERNQPLLHEKNPYFTIAVIWKHVPYGPKGTPHT